MTTHRWISAALCASLLILSHRAAAEVDEIVVYGKRPDAVVELDRGAARVDVARERRALNASLERALAADPKLKAQRIASAPTRPRS
jgi:hypothetical protein